MKAVIFDLDGTLQTLRIDFKSLRTSLEDLFTEHGAVLIEGPLLESVENAMAGLARKGLGARRLSIIRNKAGDIMDEAELVSFPKVRTIPGVLPMLRRVSKEGYGMSVLSRACRPYIDISLKRIGIAFDAVLSRNDVLLPKPDPEGVLRLLKKMKCHPGECWVVGDHPFDILAGKRAGTYTAGVLTGSSDRKRLEDAGADIVLRRADSELVKWLVRK